MQRVPDLPWPPDLFLGNQDHVVDEGGHKPTLVWTNPEAPRHEITAPAMLCPASHTMSCGQAITSPRVTAPYQRFRWRVKNMLP